MSFGGRAPPGPANELNAPADSLAVAARRCRNKGRRKRRKARERRDREAAPAQSFL